MSPWHPQPYSKYFIRGMCFKMHLKINARRAICQSLSWQSGADSPRAFAGTPPRICLLGRCQMPGRRSDLLWGQLEEPPAKQKRKRLDAKSCRYLSEPAASGKLHLSFARRIVWFSDSSKGPFHPSLWVRDVSYLSWLQLIIRKTVARRQYVGLFILSKCLRGRRHMTGLGLFCISFL